MTEESKAQDKSKKYIADADSHNTYFFKKKTEFISENGQLRILASPRRIELLLQG